MLKTDPALSQEPYQINCNKDGIDNNTVNRILDQLEYRIYITLIQCTNTHNRTYNTRPLHRIHFEGYILRDGIVVDLLDDCCGDLEEVCGDQQVVCDAHEEEK